MERRNDLRAIDCDPVEHQFSDQPQGGEEGDGCQRCEHERFLIVLDPTWSLQLSSSSVR